MQPKNVQKWITVLKATVFSVAIAVMTVIGLMWFLRPDVSEIEKRKLTEFPAFTWSSFWDGSWFSGVDKWYADTYPLREFLVNGNNSMKALYGKSSEQIVVSADKSADEIPTVSGEVEEATLPPAAAVDTEEEEEEQSGEPRDGVVTEKGETIDDVYVCDDSGYALYYFLQENSDWYAAVINEAQKKYEGKAEVYSIIAPINSGIMLSDALQKELHASDQREAINYIFSKMNNKVHKVFTFDAIRNHCDEYVYFRTDHHWTALGAYYAYTCFAKEKGVEPHKLSDFKTVSYDGFLGTFYASTRLAKMEENPDTVTAYVPMGTNKMMLTAANGETMPWNIVDDVSNYGSSVKYSCFVCGDMPISWAENPQIKDGSSCVVIKDSYGNAFVPFLIDHYQYTYWVDYRHYEGSLTELIDEKGIKDVIFLHNVYNTAYKTAIKNVQNLIER